MKTVTICADDFGIHKNVSQAIIDLINNNRIHATSCLVNFPNWHWGITDISNVKTADLGLHLNFTEGNGLSSFFANGFSKISQVLLKTHLRIYSQQHIKAEISCQLNNFVKHVGRFPDYIDGHQHVHCFPVIQQALFDVLEQQQLDKKIWIRSITPNIQTTAWIKNKIIELAIAYNFSANIKQASNYYTNNSFSGVYSLSGAENFTALMQQWLQQSADNGIIMCHPATLTTASNLDFATARYQEYQYLNSEQLLQDCSQYNIQLGLLSAN